MGKEWYSDTLKCNVMEYYPVSIGYFMRTDRGNLYMPNYSQDGFCYKNVDAKDDEVAYVSEQQADMFEDKLKHALETNISFDNLMETYHKKDLLNIVNGNQALYEVMIGNLSYEDPNTWYEEYRRDLDEAC